MLGLAEHLRDALWRVDSSGARPVDAPGGVIVAGMGGSAAGARLARGALGAAADAAVSSPTATRCPAGPGRRRWCCARATRGTEETLAAYDDAAARGAPRLVATTGGPLAERARARRRAGDPAARRLPAAGGDRVRAGGALEAAALAGAGAVAARRDRGGGGPRRALATEWGPDGGDDGEAKALARALHGTVPVIAGAELAAAAAYRWKCQFNENAALPAFASVLPEADHNEVVGWAAARELGRFSYVSLEDPGAHPRNALRAELTAEIAAAGADPVLRVRARGETPVERLVSLVLLGDLVTIYAAVLRGADPVDIPAIDALKAALAER